MSAESTSVSIVSTRAELDALHPQWDALSAARQDPLLSHRWHASAAWTLHGEQDLHLILVRRESRLVAIAPLANKRRHGVQWLELIGSSVLYEPGDLLAEDLDARTRLCEAMLAADRPLLLQRVPADPKLVEEMRRLARGRGRVYIAASAPSHRVDFEGDWETFLSARSAQLRSGLRRKRAILEQVGVVTFESLRPAPAELPSILEEAIDVEADGWKGAAGTALRHNDQLRHFVLELASRFAGSSELRVCFIRAGGRAVATSVLLECDRRLWEIKIGYRQSAERASPGRLLLLETLREAFGRGLRSYEFLGSGDGQQPDWATSSRSLHTLIYYPNSASGIWAFALDQVHRLLRRLRH